jgi:hypothetical protein
MKSPAESRTAEENIAAASASTIEQANKGFGKK